MSAPTGPSPRPTRASVRQRGRTVEVAAARPTSEAEGVPESHGARVAVRRPRGPLGGRPGMPPVTVRMPWGHGLLHHGITQWTPEIGTRFVAAYWASGGNLGAACKATGVAYRAAVWWRAEEPACRAALAECDAAIRDVVHGQFMARVLNPGERNPAWKLAYFKKHFPEYVTPSPAVAVTVAVVDSTIRPGAIAATEVRALAAGPTEGTG